MSGAPPGSTGSVPVVARDIVLEVSEVAVQFGGVRAIDDASLVVGRRELVGVIGPNGAGKTTLFDVISGFRRPTRGRVELDGADVTGRSVAWRARHGIRRTFQRQQVFGALTVRENLLAAVEGDRMRGGVVVDLVGLSSRRSGASRQAQRVDDVLELCDLGAMRDVPAGSLPIGAARMLELGRALVHEPRVLLLDEPTSGLGEAEAAAMSTALRAYLADHECGVVLVEHDVGFVMDHCDRIVVLNLGAVLAAGPPDVVRADPAVRAAYLG